MPKSEWKKRKRTNEWTCKQPTITLRVNFRSSRTTVPRPWAPTNVNKRNENKRALGKWMGGLSRKENFAPGFDSIKFFQNEDNSAFHLRSTYFWNLGRTYDRPVKTCAHEGRDGTSWKKVGVVWIEKKNPGLVFFHRPRHFALLTWKWLVSKWKSFWWNESVADRQIEILTIWNSKKGVQMIPLKIFRETTTVTGNQHFEIQS